MDNGQIPNKDFQNFNFKQADKEDVLGLMYRNDEVENKLRLDVMTYLQGIVCQMALALKISNSFQSAYAPSQLSSQQV